MNITIEDIRRAILCSGDVSTFAKVWQRALGNPPVPIVDSLEVLLRLPETTALFKNGDNDFEEAMAPWLDNKNPQLPSKLEIDLTVVGIAPFGCNIGSYLEHAVDQINPDIIVVDTPPLVLSASMLYAFGIPCAVGLPAYGEIVAKNLGQVYASETFYPGNMNETAIMKSWLTKIPLLPVGVPQKPMHSDLGSEEGYIGEAYVDRLTSKSSLLAAYHTLDKTLNGITNLQEGINITKDICLSLMQTISGSMSSKSREVLVEEARYIASRIMEVAALANTWKRKARLLAAVDIAHYLDVEYIAELLGRGIADEIYVPQKSYARARDVVLVGKSRDKLKEEAEECAPKSTLAQGLFRSEFDKLIEMKNAEILSESEAHKLIAEITGRTRVHPDIVRGASIRGTIAFAEILGSLSEIQGGLVRENIGKAALITLAPRILPRQKGSEVAIVSDIAKEVLYGIRFSGGGETALYKALEHLSVEDIVGSLNKLEQISPVQNRELAQRKLPATVVDTGKNREMLKYLETIKFLKKGRQNQYSFTTKALEYLISELEQKLRAGEITPDEYSQEKARLMEMLKNISQPQFKMSAKELANTIMEIMDAQDKQWNTEVSFDTMHVYYHIKASSDEGAELSPQKRDYHGLGMLIDDLEKQRILKMAGKPSGFTLTGIALNKLLEYLIEKDLKSRALRGTSGLGKAPANERKYETRRYSPGDVFHDISIRRTLKEIAKQKRDLSSVRSCDFRVFLKQHRKPQSDIVLCLDISGSMGFHQKLTYARLAAAALVHAAERKDRIGMVAFNDSGQLAVPLTDRDRDTLIDCIASLTARGNTNIGDGIRYSSQLLFQNQSHNQKCIVLITDGQPTAISERAFAQLKGLEERDLTEESALLETRQAAARGITVSVIHVASKGEASGEFIRNIARVGKGKVHRISRPEDLKPILY